MNKLFSAAITLILLMCGCAPTAVPVSTSKGSINLQDNSITQQNEFLTVTARVKDFEYAPYRLVDNITTFEITVLNRGGQPYSLPLESFWVLDDEGRQYRAIPAEEVRGITQRDSSYLIPYPYVGYYYLEDSERFSQQNTFTSSLPYYAENHPQDIFTEAFPADKPILPGAKVSGLVYVVVDLTSKKNVELRIYLPGTSVTETADFLFPFSIEK